MKRREEGQGTWASNTQTRTPSAEPFPRVKQLPQRRRCSNDRGDAGFRVDKRRTNGVFSWRATPRLQPSRSRVSESDPPKPWRRRVGKQRKRAGRAAASACALSGGPKKTAGLWGPAVWEVKLGRKRPIGRVQRRETLQRLELISQCSNMQGERGVTFLRPGHIYLFLLSFPIAYVILQVHTCKNAYAALKLLAPAPLKQAPRACRTRRPLSKA